MGVVEDDTELIVAEMEENNLFPSPEEPEDLFDQVVDGIQEVQEGIPMKHDVESETESDFVIPSSRMPWMPSKPCRRMRWEGGDEYVLGGTFDLAQ